MDEKKYIEMKQSFTEYLTEKKLRKTEERYAIFECICRFAGHFDMYSLQEKLEEANFHVSRATLYNTLDVLEDGGLIVRHQLNAQSVQYELRALAETHLHLVCMKCGAIREMKDCVQSKIADLWTKVTSENIKEISDIDGYWEDFYQMFGFHFDNVDYAADVEI